MVKVCRLAIGTPVSFILQPWQLFFTILASLPHREQ